MRRDQIGIIQMCMLLTMAMGLVNHVTIIPLLLSTANKDSWLSVVIAVPLCAIWTLVPYYTSKLSKQADMAVWLKENVHGSVAWAFVIVPSHSHAPRGFGPIAELRDSRVLENLKQSGTWRRCLRDRQAILPRMSDLPGKRQAKTFCGTGRVSCPRTV